MNEFNLERFVQAQQTGYAPVLDELRQGRKRTHWMWFVFPQLAGLGRSPTAQLYAIGGPAEARAYLAHPVLGPRLVECTETVLAHAGTSPEEIFGAVDALKFRSSLTLFETVEPEPFGQALKIFYAGGRDPLTLRLLGSTT